MIWGYAMACSGAAAAAQANAELQFRMGLYNAQMGCQAQQAANTPGCRYCGSRITTERCRSCGAPK